MRLEVAHDQVRSAVLSMMSDAQRSAAHTSLAEALEKLGNPVEDSERIAQHFELAGCPDRAARYCEKAAATAFESLAFDRAARLYRKTLTLGDPPLSHRRVLLRRLAASLSNAGRGRDAAEVFIEAAEMCESEESLERLSLRRLACEQYLRSGYFEAGMELARNLLDVTNVWSPRKPWQVALSLGWLSLRLQVNNYRFRERAADAVSQRELAKLDVCWRHWAWKVSQPQLKVQTAG